jgi:hypothetical protein
MRTRYIALSIGAALLFVSSAMAQSSRAALPPDLQKALEAFNNRKKYTAFDLQTLRSIKDDDLEQALLDFIMAKLQARPGQDRAVIAELGPSFQAFYVSWLVEAEVMNGGFNQFFWNSSSQFAEQTPRALETIGAVQAAQVMRKALVVAASEASRRNEFKKRGSLQAFSESYQHTGLNELDGPFTKLAGEFSAKRVRCVRDNERDFVTR